MDNSTNKIYQMHLLQSKILDHWNKHFPGQMVNTQSAQGLHHQRVYAKKLEIPRTMKQPLFGRTITKSQTLNL